MNNTFRFDFGAGDAYEGFIKITEDMIYSDELGYGIEKSTKSAVKTKGEIEFLRDYLDFSENTFKVHLDNGAYRVRVYSGDYDDLGDVMSVFDVNGEELGFWIHEEEMLCKEVEVEVKDSELKIKAMSGRHICLNAVEIAPKVILDKVNVKTEFAVSEDAQKVTLLWDTVEGAVAYRVKRKRFTDDETDINVIVSGTSFEDCDVSICGKFEYSVAPLDSVNFACCEDTVVPVCVANKNEMTDSISDLSAEVSENRVSLKWTGTDGILSYDIYKKAPLGLSKKIASVKECGYIDNDVLTCVPFEYRVEGITVNGITEATITTEIKADRPKRFMETLNRGAIAVKTENGIFVSWRLKGYEYDKGISFIVLRNGERITEKPIEDCTCFEDKNGKPGDKYTIKAVKDGKAERNGESVIASEFEYIPIAIDKPEPYTTPDGNTYEYYANDVIPADLDGDGEYEFVLKWVANPKDNSQKGYTGVYYVDAYKMDGTKMWRMNLGVNIRAGGHYAQIMVYDFDRDGKAEIICKTADGTVDAAGTVVGDINADYRNSDGFIIEGSEYLSAFNGETGTLLDTVPYDPPRGNVLDWGDSWGNRVDRFLACVAYLDGVNPSAVMCRGYYDHGRPSHLVAYNLIDKKLVKKWAFRADKTQNINYTAQGNHSLGVGDVDGDRMDEIVYGAMGVDHNGMGMYSTGLGHGDAQHLGKFMPHEDGLQYYEIHEEDYAELGYEVHNPATGEIRWGKYTGRDTARGMCAKIDPRYEGNQIWAIGEPLYTFDGDVIEEECPKTCKFTVWWDGDLLRELLDYIPDEDVPWNGRPIVFKWDWENGELKTIFEPIGAKAIYQTKGTPCLQADILGDWREELIYTNDDCTELRIYTATTPTKHRFYTLMHDHVYRLAIALQNTAYNTPPHTGFYIGDEMEKPPVPESRYVQGEELPEFVDEI